MSAILLESFNFQNWAGITVAELNFLCFNFFRVIINFSIGNVLSKLFGAKLSAWELPEAKAKTAAEIEKKSIEILT